MRKIKITPLQASEIVNIGLIEAYWKKPGIITDDIIKVVIENLLTFMEKDFLKEIIKIRIGDRK